MRTNIALTPVVRDNLRRIIMAYPAPCSASPRSYFEALELAERRALHSYFDQHIVEDEELGSIALDEGDYVALPAHLAPHVVHTIHGAFMNAFRSDERRVGKEGVSTYKLRESRVH